MNTDINRIESRGKMANEESQIQGGIDLSCYITISNLSDQDLLLDDSAIISGKWPLRQPLNIIEAGTRQTIQLQDPKVWGGSRGWVRYETRVGDAWENFRLEFACPQTPFSENTIAITSKSSGVSVDVLDLATHGHPLTGDVEVRVPSSTPKSGMEVSDTHAELSTKPGECDFIRAKYDIGVGISYPVETKLKHPIHESIAIAAFINSNIPFPRGTFYNNINDKQWEYFRGLLWNDDPSCLLFLDDAEDSRLFGLGIEWLDEYKFGDDSCMTRRSHLGNLQFLHGMGSYEGEDPIETRQRLLDWLQIMYKLACGDQGVSEDGHLKKHFPQHFGKDTTPSKHDTLRDLLLATTPGYARANIKQRALGSCLHIIADSFALGHTHRRLRNPLDLAEQEEDRYIRFRPGTYGDWGPVLCFHTYSSQDSDRHSHYDSRAGDEDPSPRDLTTFNEIVGARNAIQASTTLINFFARKTRWEEGVSDFLENCVFELDKDSRPSNHFVDEDVIDEIYRTRMVKVDTKYNEVYPGNFRKQRDGHDEELGWEQKCGRAGNYYLDVVALFFVMACFSTYFLYRIA